ncbi:MAG: response regulator [Candidatus Marinimicrobia bacterium]|nr:response regulator [Candidatus Neomarinimicrobiota bacterium]
MKVLIIEDNPINRLLLKKILSHHGVDVLEAENGKIGIEKARNQIPNLILLDLQLPEIDGCTVAKTLKADESTAHIPLIAVSANVREADKMKAIEAGCEGFIEKPVNTRTLFEQIKQYVS